SPTNRTRLARPPVGKARRSGHVRATAHYRSPLPSSALESRERTRRERALPPPLIARGVENGKAVGGAGARPSCRHAVRVHARMPLRRRNWGTSAPRVPFRLALRALALGSTEMISRAGSPVGVRPSD